MKEVFSGVHNTIKWSEKNTNVPIHYILFLIILFFVWKPKYIIILGAENWLPIPLQRFMLSFVNEVYSNIFVIITVLVIFSIILFVLSEYTPILDKLLPDKERITDNEMLSWNQVSAINKIIKIIKDLLSTYWIYYFLINIILNKHNYVVNFFKYDTLSQNSLITENYITEFNFIFMNGIFWINVLVAIYFVVNALFQIKIPFYTSDIKGIEIDRYYGRKYIMLNKFVTKGDERSKEIAILKGRHEETPIFYLVIQRLQSDVSTTRNLKINSNIDVTYKVINSSVNLDEIIYHFEFLKENNNNIEL